MIEQLRATPDPVQLPGPRMPADRGLIALGMLMQLAGIVGVTCAGALAIAALTSGNAASPPVFFLGALCAMRSMFHAAAGTSLVYARGVRARRDIARYVGISVAHSIVVLLFVEQRAVGDAYGLLALGAALLAWPAVVAITFSRPRIDAALGDGLGTLGDFGFESMSLLMAFFGACGAAVGVAIAIELTTSPAALLVSPAGTIILLVACAMIVRSMVQGVSGARGIGGAGYYTATENAGRYYEHVVGSSVTIVAGVFMCAALLGPPATAAVIGGCAGVLSWAWPSIVRRYYREQTFTVFLSGEEPILVRPPDGGVTTWGWLLVAAGTAGLALALGALIAADHVGLARSPWWLVAAALAQLYAGSEMVRMTARIRAVGALAGAFVMGTAIYVGWPIASELAGIETSACAAAVARATGTSYVAIGLILGLGTMIMPTRVPASAATALYWNHARRIHRG